MKRDAEIEGQGRMAALVAELAKDPRPFRELSPEERCLEAARAITPEVEKISGLIPEEVDARDEYREHVLRKHR